VETHARIPLSLSGQATKKHALEFIQVSTSTSSGLSFSDFSCSRNAFVYSSWGIRKKGQGFLLNARAAPAELFKRIKARTGSCARVQLAAGISFVRTRNPHKRLISSRETHRAVCFHLTSARNRFFSQQQWKKLFCSARPISLIKMRVAKSAFGDNAARRISLSSLFFFLRDRERCFKLDAAIHSIFEGAAGGNLTPTIYNEAVSFVNTERNVSRMWAAACVVCVDFAIELLCATGGYWNVKFLRRAHSKRDVSGAEYLMNYSSLERFE
jgi:hypothetical protein